MNYVQKIEATHLTADQPKEFMHFLAGALTCHWQRIPASGQLVCAWAPHATLHDQDVANYGQLSGQSLASSAQLFPGFRA